MEEDEVDLIVLNMSCIESTAVAKEPNNPESLPASK